MPDSLISTGWSGLTNLRASRSWASVTFRTFTCRSSRRSFEVKGVLDSTDEAKLSALVPAAAKHGVLTILAEPGEPVRFRLCRPTPEMEERAAIDPAYAEVCSWEFKPECDISEDAAMVHCAACGRWYFIDSSMSWKCTGCGAYDGNMTFDRVHPGSPGWSCHDCPDCGERGD